VIGQNKLPSSNAVIGQNKLPSSNAVIGQNKSPSSNAVIGQHNVLPKKIGVLVVNLGSPTTPTTGAVRRFLRQFLSDPRVIPLARGLPNLFWWPLLRFVILPIRSSKSAKKYRGIWRSQDNQSPLHYYTDNIARKLQTSMAKNILIRSAYRYGDRPGDKAVGDKQMGKKKTASHDIGGGSIEREIKNLQSMGCRRIVVLPLYPHYSTSTTASIIDEIGRVLKKMQHQPTINIVPPYFDHQDFIALLKKSVGDFFRDSKGGKKPAAQIIVSNHGIPKSFVNNGDPYSCQAKKTARLLRESLRRDSTTMPTAFQSRFGANEWVKPYCVDVVKQLAAQGCNRLAIIAPSFAVDCLETLEEINMELRADFFKHHASPNQAEFFYIPCLNDTAPAIAFYQKILSPFLSY
ncbi:MAG: ferrochelatase, partial [Hydrotalea sp.]|nr:ferrochelatase [Hydrotalea sp.]